MLYFNSKLYKQASQAYQEADYHKALTIYGEAYKKLYSVMPMAQQSVAFIDTKVYLQSRITVILISLLAQAPIEKTVLPMLDEGWKEIKRGMMQLRINAAILDEHPRQLASTTILKDTWTTLVEKCDAISDNLHEFYIDDKNQGFRMRPFLNAVEEWKLRAINLSNNFNIPIEPETHLDWLNLRELQFQSSKELPILENMHNHIAAFDLLNTMKKANKLELFCYYLRCAPNIDSTALTDIKAQGEAIISSLKKTRIITKEFRNEIKILEKKQNHLPAPENIEPIVANQSSELKSILKKSTSNPNAPHKNISFGLFPAIAWVKKDSPTTYNSLFTRFILMIKELSRAYESNAFSAMLLSLCGDFFFNTTIIPCHYSIKDSLMFPVIGEIYTAANECQSLPEKTGQAFLITTVTSALMALKPFINATTHEEMIGELFNSLITTIKKTPSLAESSEDIISLMNDVFNSNKTPDSEEEIFHSPGYG